MNRSGAAPTPDGGSLAFEVVGDGPPLLLVRPLGGSMALWGDFRAHLAQEHLVLAYDPRGVGASSAPPWDVTTRSLARDAAAVLDHLGIARADVFGISLGGMTAQWLAIDAADRVAKLVLASTSARGLDLVHAGVRRGVAFAASMFADDAEVELVDRVLSSRFRRLHRRAVARIEAVVAAHGAARADLVKLALAGARHDAREHLAELPAEVLVLAGANDNLLGLGAQRALAAAARAELRVLDAGHDLTLEAPRATAEAVLAFLGGAHLQS